MNSEIFVIFAMVLVYYVKVAKVQWNTPEDLLNFVVIQKDKLLKLPRILGKKENFPSANKLKSFSMPDYPALLYIFLWRIIMPKDCTECDENGMVDGEICDYCDGSNMICDCGNPTERIEGGFSCCYECTAPSEEIIPS